MRTMHGTRVVLPPKMSIGALQLGPDRFTPVTVAERTGSGPELIRIRGNHALKLLMSTVIVLVLGSEFPASNRAVGHQNAALKTLLQNAAS